MQKNLGGPMVLGMVLTGGCGSSLHPVRVTVSSLAQIEATQGGGFPLQ